MIAKKRIMPILAALLMVFVMMSMNTKSVFASDRYGLWIGGIEVTSDNKDNVTGEGLSGKITYNPNTKTLALNNAKINSGHIYYLNDNAYAGTYSAAGIYSTENIDIILAGKSSIIPSIKLSGDYYYNKIQGINVGDVHFTGSGSLAVTGCDYGIISHALTVDQGSKINVNADNGSTGPCIGVSASKIVVNGELTSNSRAVFQPSVGISAKDIIIGRTGTITAEAKNPNTSYDAEAIHITGMMTVNGAVTKVGNQKYISLKGNEKAANPLKIISKTATVKYSKLKKKAQTLAVTKVLKFTKDGKDKKNYTLSSAKKGSKSFKKYFKINKTTGKVTIKKGLKKGTYNVKANVKALGNKNYKASAVKTVTFKIKVQ